jgi:hypothetical protein
VSAGRGARPVEVAGLDEQHVWLLVHTPIPGGALGVRDLLERPADVDRAGPLAAGGTPGHRPVERPVHLEYTGSVAIACEPPAIAAGHPRAGDAEELTRGDIAQDGA